MLRTQPVNCINPRKTEGYINIVCGFNKRKLANDAVTYIVCAICYQITLCELLLYIQVINCTCISVRYCFDSRNTWSLRDTTCSLRGTADLLIKSLQRPFTVWDRNFQLYLAGVIPVLVQFCERMFRYLMCANILKPLVMIRY